MSVVNLLREYEIVDLSHTIEDGMPRPQVPYGHIPWKSYDRGDSFNTFMILLFEHAGTHVDAPIHLGGVEGPTIDQVPLDSWIGECCVLDMTHKKEREYVTKADIEAWETAHRRIRRGEIVLLNYGWQKRWRVPSGVENQPFLRDNPGLSEDAALTMADRGVKLVGADTPTIDSHDDPEERAHKVLLPRGILIMENAANLDKLPPVGSIIMAFPLKIGRGTGSPVRAVAMIPKTV